MGTVRQPAAQSPKILVRSRPIYVPAWATSFGIHCLAIILLGLFTFGDVAVGTRGVADVALSWQEASGEEQFDLDAGALPGDAATVEIAAATEAIELNTWTTDQWAELLNAPASLSLELPSSPSPGERSAMELSGLLGAGAGRSGKGANRGQGSGYGRTRFFGLEAEGNKFVYVFDRSHSMNEYGGVPLEAAKLELLSSIEHLGDQQQFYIVYYNHNWQEYVPPGYSRDSRGRLVFASSAMKNLARQFIYSMRADGGTHHAPALERAVRYRADVIFLLTDGEEKDDLTLNELRTITRLNSGGASIHVIQFAAQPRPRSTLVQLAKRNRGKHTFIDIARLTARFTAADNER